MSVIPEDDLLELIENANRKNQFENRPILWRLLLYMMDYYNPDKYLQILSRYFTAYDIYTTYMSDSKDAIIEMNDICIYNIFKCFPDLIFLFSKETLARIVWREYYYHTMYVLSLIKKYIGSKHDTTELYKYVKNYIRDRCGKLQYRENENLLITEIMIEKPYDWSKY